MSLHVPRRPAVRDDWDAWAARAYGSTEQWKATRARYWRSRWTLFRRCLICRAGKSKDGKDLELNHLTYRFTRLRRGWTPLWAMVPLCHRCHGFETRLARWLRRHKVNFGEHVVATFGPWLVTRSILVGVAWVLWHFAPW